MGEDVGYGGSYVPLIVGEGTLNELRNFAGPAPEDGRKIVQVNLATGEFKWAPRARRRAPARRTTYRRRK